MPSSAGPGRSRVLAGARRAAAALPLGLAHGWKVTQPVTAGEPVRWVDVVVDEANSAVRVRREMEQMCAAQLDMVVT